ncbi:UbiD family decarboxylase [uncultured Rhodospira sp.]|uniref:UbiD family decarboxylase n=1 Tax=uncultured Rhodospira sp. TaxID=1936189 RepID=UPI002633DDBD|nr:UbiD family decarboxylase [uncultured Rhodospira sp.]
MTERPALSIRAALAAVRARAPGQCHRHEALAPTDVAAHFADCYAGVPATGRACSEDVALYDTGTGARLPVLLGLYGDEARVRDYLPGLPATLAPQATLRWLEAAPNPIIVNNPPCRQVTEAAVDLRRLPVLTTTPRDAGPYVTMGLVLARDPETGEDSLSIHRMLVIGPDRLTLWMVPGRRLRALYEAAVARGERLAVTVNIGPPPAAAVASAVGTAHLPHGRSKLGVAGALAMQPIPLAQAADHPCPALATAEIVLEGFLDGTQADEGPHPLGNAMPEFLGYDGPAKPDLPVLTVTRMTMRAGAIYQAVIGPGREQSSILGIAGALSVALSLAGDDPALAAMVRDIRFPSAGGGMLLLVLSIRKARPEDDVRFAALAHHVFARHGFVKLILFVDDDINLDNAEDLLWAVTTRANLRTDCVGLTGYPDLPMDPSQRETWLAARPGDGQGAGRSYIDATTPYDLRASTVRSFATTVEA